MSTQVEMGLGQQFSDMCIMVSQCRKQTSKRVRRIDWTCREKASIGHFCLKQRYNEVSLFHFPGTSFQIGNLEGTRGFREEIMRNTANHVKEFEQSHLGNGETLSAYGSRQMWSDMLLRRSTPYAFFLYICIYPRNGLIAFIRFWKASMTPNSYGPWHRK